MPLIHSKAEDARNNVKNILLGLQGDLESAVRKLDAITKEYTSLPDADLAEFANDLGPVEMQQLVAAHGANGDTLNALIGGLNTVLFSIGKPLCTAQVDVRPLAEKLAAQGREIVFDGTAFVVNQLPPTDPPVDPAP